MKIVCKNCGNVNDAYAIPTPQVTPTTNWPIDWVIYGYCPECSIEREVECLNCKTKFFTFNSEQCICKTCKNIKW